MSGLYETVFGAPPGAVGRAPARANLLGEHTDYNDGFVLPTPLAFHTTVEAGMGDDAADADAAMVTAHAAQFGATVTRRLDRPRQGDWMDYVVGCLSVLAERGSAIPPLRLAVASDVPMGAGVSSSAALEVAVLRAVRDLLDLDLDDRTLAQLGRRAENRYVGMQCGIMDQMVAALGVFGKALLLDTSDLTTRLIDLPDRHRIAIVHCGVAHKLTEGAYNTRRGECEAAADRLGVASLRDVGLDDLDRIAALAPPLDRRARHVVTENRRVLDGVAALERGDIGAFGVLMNASHDSQRDDYDVSIPEIDALVDSARRHGAVGARLTGGGFGGSIVALVEETAYDAWLRAVLADRPQAQPI